MKKIVKLLVSLLMVLSLTFCFVIQSFAFDYQFSHTQGYYYHTNIASAYFTHNQTFGDNHANSCTFIAIQMLLSYYDSFWSDDFISIDYEDSDSGRIAILNNTVEFSDSPGTKKELFYEEGDLPYSDYDGFIENCYDSDFQLYLMHLAKQEGFIDGSDSSDGVQNDNDSNNNNNNNDEDFALSRTEMVDFLEFYLYNVVTVEDDEGAYVNLTQQQITVHSMLNSDPDYSEEAVRTQLVNLVSSGTPVIYCGKRYETDDETLSVSGL